MKLILRTLGTDFLSVVYSRCPSNTFVPKKPARIKFRMAQADPRIKKLKIQTGVVKRITKEKDMYEKEAMQIEGKIEKMKTDGTDEYVLRKQQEVLQESKQMVPDTQKRLKNAYEELKCLTEDSEKDLCECEEHKNALTALEAAKPVVDA